MFLALREIKYAKLRYGLIMTMILLISYLIFILTSLAVGLASQNTQALKSWQPKSIVLNKNANVNIGQSLLLQSDLDKAHFNPRTEAVVGNAPVVATGKHAKVSSQFMGLYPHQYVAKQLQLTSGHAARNAQQVVVDQKFKQTGYQLGDHLQFNGGSNRYQIVGFVKNAKYNIAPVVYGSLSTWHTLRNLDGRFAGSAVLSQRAHFQIPSSQLHSYKPQTVINNLPGYTAQTLTFTLMIGFLMIISLIIIAVFLYILTMQKLPNYAVLRAQGIPARKLVNATIAQTVILVVSGMGAGLLLTLVTLFVLPAAVPVAISWPIMLATVVGLLGTSMLGACLPALLIVQIDPADAIGG
ncbi:ABC transporter permease [Fructilactobacillus myrtifloralis]|uniref:Putative hemin transport system permease protein HrtB n=1 Tax=Fructilactobacillus myrtifloralis TaxID=2940301 RepID=A0ABY5BQZ5_9LACO|nr:ABC transporter permease [Fructilactobacillus myrtifloralis]USS84819.1 ABC transporter permease [Fructilactobacillus myrtifloralis]